VKPKLKRNAQVKNVLDIEDFKPRLNQEKHAKHGHQIVHISININLKSIQRMIYQRITAETHRIVTQFGAILQTQVKDGLIVIQLLRVRKLKDNQDQLYRLNLKIHQ
jgi:hypothetical protein